MNPGYNDAMQIHHKCGSVRYIRRAIPALSARILGVVMVTTITTTARAGDAPINLCDYSGPSFDKVNALLHDRVRPGDHVDRLRNLLSATPGVIFGKMKPARFVNFTGSLFDGTFEFLEPFTKENGLFTGAGVECQKSQDNFDFWVVYIHAESKQELIEFQVVLFYLDEKFTARNEALNMNRYLDIARGSREVEKAVTEPVPTDATAFETSSRNKVLFMKTPCHA